MFNAAGATALSSGSLRISYNLATGNADSYDGPEMVFIRPFDRLSTFLRNMVEAVMGAARDDEGFYPSPFNSVPANRRGRRKESIWRYLYLLENRIRYQAVIGALSASIQGMERHMAATEAMLLDHAAELQEALGGFYQDVRGDLRGAQEKVRYCRDVIEKPERLGVYELRKIRRDIDQAMAEMKAVDARILECYGGAYWNEMAYDMEPEPDITAAE